MSKISLFLIPFIFLMGCSTGDNTILIEGGNVDFFDEVTGSLSSGSILSGVDLSSGDSITIVHPRSSKTMMDYLLTLTRDDLLIACDNTSEETNKENRRKLIDINDEKNGYIQLKDIESREYTAGPILHQIVRYYMKTNEALIVVNRVCGDGCMCNGTDFFQEDPLTHEMLPYYGKSVTPLGYGFPECKDNDTIPAYPDPNQLKKYLTTMEENNDMMDFWIFPHYGKTAFWISQGSVNGYASWDGEEFSGCFNYDYE